MFILLCWMIFAFMMSMFLFQGVTISVKIQGKSGVRIKFKLLLKLPDLCFSLMYFFFFFTFFYTAPITTICILLLMINPLLCMDVNIRNLWCGSFGAIASIPQLSAMQGGFKSDKRQNVPCHGHGRRYLPRQRDWNVSEQGRQS